jgi:hypothetical protein
VTHIERLSIPASNGIYEITFEQLRSIDACPARTRTNGSEERQVVGLGVIIGAARTVSAAWLSVRTHCSLLLQVARARSVKVVVGIGDFVPTLAELCGRSIPDPLQSICLNQSICPKAFTDGPTTIKHWTRRAKVLHGGSYIARSYERRNAHIHC